MPRIIILVFLLACSGLAFADYDASATPNAAHCIPSMDRAIDGAFYPDRQTACESGVSARHEPYYNYFTMFVVFSPPSQCTINTENSDGTTSVYVNINILCDQPKYYCPDGGDLQGTRCISHRPPCPDDGPSECPKTSHLEQSPYTDLSCAGTGYHRACVSNGATDGGTSGSGSGSGSSSGGSSDGSSGSGSGSGTNEPPGGQSSSGTKCPNGSYQGADGGCPGYIKDAATGDWIKDNSAPGGAGTGDSVPANADGSCGPGYTRSSGPGAECIRDAGSGSGSASSNCPAGTEWNSAIQQCAPLGTTEPPSGGSSSSSGGSGSSGSSSSSGSSTSCPAGSVWNALLGKCAPLGTTQPAAPDASGNCPSGYSKIDGACVPQETSGSQSSNMCPDCAKDVTLQKTNDLVQKLSDNVGSSSAEPAKYSSKPSNLKPPADDYDQQIIEAQQDLSNQINQIRGEAASLFSAPLVPEGLPCITADLGRWGSYQFCFDAYVEQLNQLKMLLICFAWLVAFYILMG
jgi:hypothetical protein